MYSLRTAAPILLLATLACGPEGLGPDGTDETGGEETEITPDLCAGWMVACALEADGSMRCWGDAEVDEEGPFMSIGCGPTHVCGVRTDGSVRCWEADNWASEEFDPEPEGTFVEVHAGYGSTCGRRSDGTVACWGDNTYAHSPAPSGTFTRIAVAWWGACGLREGGSLECWGSEFGPEGLEDLSGTYNALALSNDVCVRELDGTLTCAQLDADAGEFVDLDSGTGHNCGVRTNNELSCWGGDNENGQLDVPPGEYLQVAVGQEFACARTVDDELRCWGADHNGSTDPP